MLNYCTSSYYTVINIETTPYRVTMCEEQYGNIEYIKEPIEIIEPIVKGEKTQIFPGMVVEYDSSNHILEPAANHDPLALQFETEVLDANFVFEPDYILGGPRSQKRIKIQYLGENHILHYLPSSTFYTTQPHDKILASLLHIPAKKKPSVEIARNLTTESETRKFFESRKNTTTSTQKTKYPRDEMFIQCAEYVVEPTKLFMLVRLIGKNFGQAALTLSPRNRFYKELQRFDYVLAEKQGTKIQIIKTLNK